MISYRLDSSSTGALRSTLTFLCLLGLFSAYATFLASGEWLAVVAITGGVVGLAVLSRGAYFVSLLWILGMPTLFVFPDRYLNALPGLNSGRILFGVLVAILVLQRVFRQAPAYRFHRAEWWSLTFLIIAFLSLVWMLPRETFAGVKVNVAMFLQAYVMSLGALFIARRVAWTTERVEACLFYLTAIGIFLATVACLQQFFGVTLFNPHHIEIINADRASGTLGNSHEFGAVMTSLAIVALLQANRQRYSGGIRAFYVFAAVFMSLAVVLTKTRGPWLAALIGLAFVFLMDRRSRPLLVCAGVVAVVAGAVLVPLLVDPDLWRYRIAEMSPIYNRLTAYATSLNAIIHNPIFGMGFSDLAFERAKDGYISNAGPISAYWATNVGVPHNEFLHLALLVGLPGLACYLLVLWHVQAELVRIRRREGDKLAGALSLYVSAIVITFVVNALLIDFSLSTYFPILLFFLAGMAIRYGEERARMPPA